MTRYSPEFKEQVVRKMMPPNNQSVASIHRESGVSTSSLYAWKRQFQEKGYVVPARICPPDGWDNKAEMTAVITSRPPNRSDVRATTVAASRRKPARQGWNGCAASPTLEPPLELRATPTRADNRRTPFAFTANGMFD